MKTALKRMDWQCKAKVYIAKDNRLNGFYKIGCSINPIKRCKTIGSGDCEIIFESTPDYFNGTEVFAHNLLDDRRHIYAGTGKSEWFKLSDCELKIVRQAIKTHSEYVALWRKHENLSREYKIIVENYWSLMKRFNMFYEIVMSSKLNWGKKFRSFVRTLLKTYGFYK